MLSGSACHPLGLRERKKARTRAAIIESALFLFERQGYEATTVEDIAASADISPRTFFRYFESKLDVVLAKTQAKNQSLGPLIAERPADEAPTEAIRQVVQQLLRAVVEDEDGSALRELKVVMGTPELRALALEHFHGDQDELVGVIADRLGVGPHDLPAHLLAGMIGTTLWTVVDRWVAEGAVDEQLPMMVDEAFAMLAPGFDAHGDAAGGRDAGRAT